MVKRTLCGTAAIILFMMVSSTAGASDKRDLTGLWSNASETTLERPAGVTALQVSAEEATRIVASKMTVGRTAAEKSVAKSDNTAPPKPGDKDFGVVAYDAAWTAPGDGLNKVNGKYRTSHVIDPADGHVPYKDPEKIKAQAAARSISYATGKGPYDGPENANVGERCIIGIGGVGGPGMLHGPYNNNFQFVLTKDHLAIDVEMAHDMRIIPIFASEQKAKVSHGPIDRWFGDSVAWWQGDTLVVESIHVPALEGANGSIKLSSQGKVTEYLTRNGPKEINYKFTVDDPVNYTRPWTAELTFQPINAIYEYACAEGNYGLEGMLAGARAKDAEQAAAATKK